ncbi:MAG: protein translocase subunit SecD [Planctomycetes bacterium]|nr:protein translocase subunit SecD [Planctomycetota bacterium]
MLENARRQLFLVLLSLVAGLFCVVWFKAQWGQDLKGGSQLRYEIPKDVLEKLVAKEGASIAAVMDQTIGVIRDRIDPTGTIDVPVTHSGETGILIELPWFDDPQELKRVQARIANLGKLEMRMVADGDYFAPATETAPEMRFDMAAEARRLEDWLRVPGNKEALLEDLRNISRFNDDPRQGPVRFGNLAWYPHLRGPSPKNPDLWDLSFKDIQLLAASTVKVYEDKDVNNGVIPEEVKKKPKKDQYLLELVAINMHEQFFSGEDLDPAGVGPAPSDTGGLAVAYKIVAAKEGDYADWSSKYLNKCSAIILNGVVKSAPRFQSRIPGRGQITGDFTTEEVDELVKVLRTGSLRVEPELVSSLTIGPTLGAAAIERGMISLVAGGVLVFAFMLWYYGIAGTIACITLVLNVFLLWAAMLFMQATITLPGLGGIVLTIGMAVDANVLIYERIREELAKGKDLLRAVRAGFERAMSAILDSNITTFLVGLVLFNIGVGPVRGFAVTLMVGIVTTVFTQFFVTRLLFHYALEKKKLLEYRPRTLFTKFDPDFVRYIRVCCTLSIVVIASGLAYALFVAPREVTLGLDFTGGADLRMVVAQPLAADTVRDRLRDDPKFRADYPNVGVNTVEEDPDGRSNQFSVRLKLTDAQRDAITAGRAEWRERRQAAETANQEPPPPYEPPYLVELRRMFQQDLVEQAYRNPKTIEDAFGSNLLWATIELNFQKPIKTADAQALVEKNKLVQGRVSVPGDPNAPSAKRVLVEWQVQSNVRSWQLFELARDALAGLQADDGKKVILSDPFPEAQEIQGRLVHDLRSAAIGALLVSWALIVLYLRVRFHEYKYGLAAVVALVHDVLFALGAVVVANHLGFVRAEISVSMIACFLTIIGYSVNDTIVIFDRIRENLHDNARQGITEPFRVLINRALNQTMSRTLLTSGVTLFVVIAQFLVNWGSGSDLESFAFAMIVGMISGVYSTIYIAAPILILMHKDTPAAGAPAAVAAPGQAAP